MSIELLTTYAKLLDEQAALKDQLKAAEALLKETQPLVLNLFQQEGVQSMKVEGRTLYLARATTYPSKRDKDLGADEIASVVSDAGFGEYARPRVNWQGLGQLFRERLEQGEPAVPKPLSPYIDFEERWEVRSRKA
jgi:hypothetical protein